MKLARLAFGLSSSLLLSACANLTEAISIQKTLDIEHPNAYSVGAKQRVILSNPIRKDGKENFHIRICAEPSPDVFSALASSHSADASGKQHINALTAALKLSGGFSEGASSIERSQTLNIWREAMYRTCERYMSGAMNDDDFFIQAARDQRMAVSLLAIEQLTGVSKARATALTSAAKASVAAHPAQLLDTAQTNLMNRRKALSESQIQLDEAAKDASADWLPTEACTNKADKQDDKVKKARFNSACQSQLNALEDKKNAQDHYSSLLALTKTMGPSISSESHTTSLSEAMKNDSVNDVAVIAAVKEIVQESNTFPEERLFCLTALRQTDPSMQTKAVHGACLDLIKSQINATKAQIDAVKAQADAKAEKSNVEILENTLRQSQIRKNL